MSEPVMSEPVTFVEERPMAGRELLAEPGLVIGREGTDIVLADPEVSRRHAVIREHAGAIAIEDLGSTNGTFVNDRRISEAEPLRDGDVVRLGKTVWRVRAPAGDTMVGSMAPEPAQATAAHEVPSAPAAPAALPPQPVATAPRGDVPAPPEIAPSAVRRVLPTPDPGRAPAFSPATQRVISSRSGSAATRVGATIVCIAAVVAVAVALAIYFAAQS